MNNPHQNARTTVQRRDLMVARHAAGRPVAKIAEEFGVSVRTVYK
ncbi:MAG: helix-turn-helix domain-containing protein [Pseudomonadota bacterium]